MLMSLVINNTGDSDDKVGSPQWSTHPILSSPIDTSFPLSLDTPLPVSFQHPQEKYVVSQHQRGDHQEARLD